MNIDELNCRTQSAKDYQKLQRLQKNTNPQLTSLALTSESAMRQDDLIMQRPQTNTQPLLPRILGDLLPSEALPGN